MTKLGRLVKARIITSIEQIYLHSVPIKEYQIVDLLVPGLKDELMKIMPVQKQSCAGQRTRFKAFVALGDSNGHVGLGVKCASEAANSIKGALILAKLTVVPVRRGYWGGKVGAPHTVPMKVTGKCGSVCVRLIPAPRGTGLVAAPATKKLLSMAGIQDVYTSARGHTRTMGNFIKATYFALQSTYAYLSPELWKQHALIESPYDSNAAFLKSGKYHSEPKAEAVEQQE